MLVRPALLAILATASVAMAANTVHAPDTRSTQHVGNVPLLKPAQAVTTTLICAASSGRHPVIWNVGPGTVPAHTKIHWTWQNYFHAEGYYEFSSDAKAHEIRKLSDINLPPKAGTVPCHIPDIDGWNIACIGAIGPLAHVCKIKLEQSPVGYIVTLKEP